MRRVLICLFVFALAGAGAGSALSAEEPQKGTLRVLRNGALIGTERYEIAATASEIQARGELDLQADDTTIRQSARLLLSADLAPRAFDLKVDGREKTWRRVEFSPAGAATIWYPLETGKEDQQVFEFGTPRVAVLGLYHHFLLLTRLYDFGKGGQQTIQVFIPYSIQPGVVRLELTGVESQTVDGAPQPVRQFIITTEDSRVLLWVTEAGRFVRLEAPLEKVEVVPESPAPAPG